MQDRTLAGQCRMDGLPRKLRAAIQSKLRLHLTPIWEGESNPDTTLRVKREQPAAKRRFSEGNSTVSQWAAASSGPSKKVSN